MAHEDIMETVELIKEFKKEIIYNNRYFFSNSIVFKSLDSLIENANNDLGPFANERLTVGSILYRARICDADIVERECQDSKTLSQVAYIFGNREFLGSRFSEHEAKILKGKGFYGYSKKDSFAPPKEKSVDGRTNPKYIRYLYTASDMYTALAEVRPNLSSYVNIAEIKVLKPIRILNMCIDKFFLFKNAETLADNFFIGSYIADGFTSPCDGELKDYLFAQVVSEYVKSKGYDGVCYTSSLNPDGKNYTIFNTKHCRAISSKIFSLDKVEYKATCITPFLTNIVLEKNSAIPSYKTQSQTRQPEAVDQAPTVSAAP